MKLSITAPDANSWGRPKFIPNAGARALLVMTFVILARSDIPGLILCAASQSLTSTSTTTKSNVSTASPPEAYRRFALLHEGSQSHGKVLFNNEQKSACARCHT